MFVRVIGTSRLNLIGYGKKGEIIVEMIVIKHTGKILKD